MRTFGITPRWRDLKQSTTFGALAVLAMAASMLTPSTALAQGAGDLIVAPTRVVFEGRTRSAQLSLVNKGSAAATYRISMVNMRMLENGSLQPVEKPGADQKTSDKLIRYSPRQVTLNPGASQAIRLLLRKPGDLANGEYRSHLLFRAIPKEGGESVEKPKDPNAVEVKLIPIFGISIPVIVRHGNLATKVAVDSIKLMPADDKNKLPRVKFRLNREGDRSVFGDLWVSTGDVVLGQIMRLAVYTPNAHRDVIMPLRVPDGVNLNGADIKVTYKTIPEQGGKLLGEASAKLP